MLSIVIAIALIVAGGLIAFALGRHRALAQRAGQWSAVAGCAIGLAGALWALAAGSEGVMSAPWTMPGGALAVGADALSAFFLVPVFGISALAAVYAPAYLDSHLPEHDAGKIWLNFNLLIAGMATVVVARDGLLFLLAWEVMALSPFFLVALQDEQERARHAGWVYLVATHLGTAFLLAMFVLLGDAAGDSGFAAYREALATHPELAAPVFLLALLGFGSKAGFVPTHVWLPEAHPAAPSPVSALMSGVMIKTGIYGLIRVMSLIGAPEDWWGWVLIAVGASSGVLGVLFALAQHDLKRLLAYHSVENIGIIALGLGIGTLGWAYEAPAVAVLGMAGALLHVLNHSVFKSLLFLGAGAVQCAAHTLNLEAMGGLAKRMPWTAATFFVGAAAIVGLPPLNGFVSEFLVFYSGFAGALGNDATVAAAGAVTLAALGLISGLAAACFAKVYGVAFLGAPRRPATAEAREVGASMRGPMTALAGACVLIGMSGPVLALGVAPMVATVTGMDAEVLRAAMAPAVRGLAWSVGVFVLLAAGVGALWLWRGARLTAGRLRRGPTWGCGYGDANPRMQYTASSFAAPLTTQFAAALHAERRERPPEGRFPAGASYHGESDDPFHHALFAPTFRWVARVAGRARVMQQGHTHVYVLYVAATLLVVLVASLVAWP